MGQYFTRGSYYVENENTKMVEKFQDLNTLPPELSLAILSKLNATDLCLAGCVWSELAYDELLWKGYYIVKYYKYILIFRLCFYSWPYCSAYKRYANSDFSFRKTFLLLDEGCLTFNADSFEGMLYLFENELVQDDPMEIAKFFHFTRQLNAEGKRRYLESRPDVLDHLMELKNFSNQFLANALRKFFKEISAPKERDNFLSRILDKFSHKFVQCNPNLSISSDKIYLLCYSLIMLSVDLCSPHVKNKMSKREFIRNTRQATHLFNDDFLGDLYDNVYLLGHVASITTG